MLLARKLATTVLDTIRSDITLDQVLAQKESQIKSLNRADRALFHAIVYGVLRWQHRLDWVIDHLTAQSKKIDPLVRIILRIGLFQIKFLDRIPISAAVHTSVELAKKNKRKWAAGFVNSVLRNAVRKEKSIHWPDRNKDPITYLSIYHSFPKWLIIRWIDHWGIDAIDELCKEINTIPKTTIRTNTLIVSKQDLIESIQTEAKEIYPTAYSPEGVSISSLYRPIAQWEAFQKGWFQVQSEASQFIAHLLSPFPGHHVWDACAGLGTKTAHMAQLMKNKGQIIATDISAGKLSRLRDEMRRLKITLVKCKQKDLTQPICDWSTDKFDRILLDAPCTGLGVLQKNPDGKWRSDLKRIQNSSRKQLKLLENCAPYLKPQGIMVYAVCSFEPEENHEIIQHFLQKHSEFAIDRPIIVHVSDRKKILTPEGYLQTVPHHHKMDGFFAAVLKKNK